MSEPIRKPCSTLFNFEKIQTKQLAIKKEKMLQIGHKRTSWKKDITILYEKNFPW